MSVTPSGARPRRPLLPRFVSRLELLDALGVSAHTLSRLVEAGELPAPTRIGLRRIAWPEPVIAEWLKRRSVPRSHDGNLSPPVEPKAPVSGVTTGG